MGTKTEHWGTENDLLERYDLGQFWEEHMMMKLEVRRFGRITLAMASKAAQAV